MSMIKNNMACLILILLFVTETTQAQTDKVKSFKPNIILIMADDLGYETLGCNGGTSYKTPNLDKLASAGIRFSNCYSTPLCTPSRVTIMTGKYNFRNYTDFGYLDPKNKTFGNMMKRAGYKTFIAGKWQLNGIESKKPGWEDLTRPNHFGFDEYYLWHLTRLKKEGERYANPLIEYNGQQLPRNSNQYGPDIFRDKIFSFLEENSKEPFFIYYPMVLTHAPFQPTADQPGFAAASSKKINDTANFKYMVNYMDKIVGQIVEKVEKLGIAENTIILFTGDNGTGKEIVSMMGNIAVKGGKGTTTVPGTHVPLIAYWKGKTPKGVVYDDLIDFTDFMPTLAEAVSFKLPQKLIIDGKSFYSRLSGKKGDPREWVYCYYTQNGNPQKAKRYAQDKVWKLYDTGAFYNIVNDPVEEKAIDINTQSPAIKESYIQLKAVINKMKSQETAREIQYNESAVEKD